MTEVVTPTTWRARRKEDPPAHPFAHVPPTPQQHFSLYLYAAALRVLEQVSEALDSRDTALEQFPFLVSYHNSLARCGLAGVALDEGSAWWQSALSAWEDTVETHLPLRALRASADLDHQALTLFMTVGLVEEDPRFGALFEALHGIQGQHRPIVALLMGQPDDASDGARSAVRRLLDVGLVHAVNADAPRLEWALQVAPLVWDAVRGDTPVTTPVGVTYRPPAQLPAMDDLILSDGLRATLARIPALLSAGEAQTVIARGLQHSGRHTVLGAVAQALGRGVLSVEDPHVLQDDRWHLVGLLATLLDALPIVALDVAPGETAVVEQPRGYAGPLALALGKQGGVSGSGVAGALTLMLETPTPAQRRAHWLAGAGASPIADVDALSAAFRMTGGNIQRLARMAQAYASLQGRAPITLSDARQAARALNRQTLDTLAVRLEAVGTWADLAVAGDTQSELRTLEMRCHHRERLNGSVGAAFASQLNCGVRALFGGPSGTGKTLAARVLAAELGMDLYRLDLSAVVNKYIGETEKNLNKVFERAEELDVILLLDEGDSLLTQRTDVQTANDRYANLETNFLLQRLESFEGILIVTTNAGDRIDSAFQRRMDVIVDFHAPDAAERLAIWQLHLPRDHAVDEALMQSVVARCRLTGGQIRNAVLHASLLALSNGGLVTSAYLEEAVQREYRKLGAVCPLRARVN